MSTETGEIKQRARVECTLVLLATTGQELVLSNSNDVKEVRAIVAERLRRGDDTELVAMETSGTGEPLCPLAGPLYCYALFDPYMSMTPSKQKRLWRALLAAGAVVVMLALGNAISFFTKAQ